MNSEEEKKMLAKFADQLSNWTPDQGNPFDFSEEEKPQEHFGFPTIKNIGKFKNFDELLPPLIAEVNFNLHLKSVFEAITSPYYAFRLLQPMEEMGFEKESHISGIKIIKMEGGKVHKERTEPKPLKVYLEYPFENICEAVVLPFEVNGGKCMHFGYLIWQISRVYADIYKNRWKEYGVWGHAFEDLYLEKMFIHEENVVSLFIGS